MAQAPASSSRWYTVQLVLGVLFGAVMFLWFVSRIDGRELWSVLSHARLDWLTVAFGLMLVSYFLQAWRWQVLLKPVDPTLPLSVAWAATAVGGAFNTLLPLRGGNFLRPAVVSLKRAVPYTTLLFTTVAEYVYDLFAIIGLALCTMYLLPPDLLGPENSLMLKEGGAAMATSAIVALVGALLIVQPGARAVFRRLLRPMPGGRFRARLIVLFDQLRDGLAAMGHPLRFVESVLITFGVWGTWLLVLLATFQAVDLDLPLGAALMLVTLLALAMHVPQAPGFLGVFQLITTQTLEVWGAQQSKADAIALLFWVVNFGPITLIGLWESWRAGLGVIGARKRALGGLAGGDDAPVTDDASRL